MQSAVPPHRRTICAFTKMNRGRRTENIRAKGFFGRRCRCIREIIHQVVFIYRVVGEAVQMIVLLSARAYHTYHPFVHDSKRLKFSLLLSWTNGWFSSRKH